MCNRTRQCCVAFCSKLPLLSLPLWNCSYVGSQFSLGPCSKLLYADSLCRTLCIWSVPAWAQLLPGVSLVEVKPHGQRRLSIRRVRHQLGQFMPSCTWQNQASYDPKFQRNCTKGLPTMQQHTNHCREIYCSISAIHCNHHTRSTLNTWYIGKNMQWYHDIMISIIVEIVFICFINPNQFDRTKHYGSANG